MKIDRTVKGLLREAGATLKRSKKHLVFGMPNGENVVLAQTPSDVNAIRNQIKDVKRHLPKDPPRVAKVRSAKPGRSGEPRHQPAPSPNNLLADQLRAIGVVESTLRTQIEELEQMVAHLANQRDACWMCRLRMWWTAFKCKHQWRSRTLQRGPEEQTKRTLE